MDSKNMNRRAFPRGMGMSSLGLGAMMLAHGIALAEEKKHLHAGYLFC